MENNNKPALPLSAYTGVYKNKLYGKLLITADSAKEGMRRLKIHFEHHQNLIAQLDYMDGNEFRLSFSNPRFGIFPITFTIAKDQVEQLEIKGTDFVDHDAYEFIKAKQ